MLTVLMPDFDSYFHQPNAPSLIYLNDDHCKPSWATTIDFDFYHPISHGATTSITSRVADSRFFHESAEGACFLSVWLIFVGDVLSCPHLRPRLFADIDGFFLAINPDI